MPFISFVSYYLAKSWFHRMHVTQQPEAGRETLSAEPSRLYISEAVKGPENVYANAVDSLSRREEFDSLLARLSFRTDLGAAI